MHTLLACLRFCIRLCIYNTYLCIDINKDWKCNMDILLAEMLSPAANQTNQQAHFNTTLAPTVNPYGTIIIPRQTKTTLNCLEFSA